MLTVRASNGGARPQGVNVTTLCPGSLNWFAVLTVRFTPRRLVTKVSYLLIGRTPA